MASLSHMQTEYAPVVGENPQIESYLLTEVRLTCTELSCAKGICPRIPVYAYLLAHRKSRRVPTKLLTEVIDLVILPGISWPTLSILSNSTAQH
jgi:hypothetical protein